MLALFWMKEKNGWNEKREEAFSFMIDHLSAIIGSIHREE
jgi:hypothetical protein